jgi:hypothetical protein
MGGRGKRRKQLLDDDENWKRKSHCVWNSRVCAAVERMAAWMDDLHELIGFYFYCALRIGCFNCIMLLTKLNFTSGNVFCWRSYWNVLIVLPEDGPFEGWNLSEWHSVNKVVYCKYVCPLVGVCLIV